MKKFCFISDTHEQHRELRIPKCDFLIHTGDHSFQMYDAEPEKELPNLRDYGEWCGELLEMGVIKHSIAIAGNHDFAFQHINDQARKALGDNVTYLQDESIEIEGYHFWGTPWTPRFFNWAFQLDTPGNGVYARVKKQMVSPAYATEVWKDVPSTVDVLLTHGPAYGWRDQTHDGRKIGCKDLARLIEGLANPIIHAFGHVHHSHGVSFDTHKGMLRINGSSCNERYEPKNRPILIEVE